MILLILNRKKNMSKIERIVKVVVGFRFKINIDFIV